MKWSESPSQNSAVSSGDGDVRCSKIRRLSRRNMSKMPLLSTARTSGKISEMLNNTPKMEMAIDSIIV